MSRTTSKTKEYPLPVDFRLILHVHALALRSLDDGMFVCRLLNKVKRQAQKDKPKGILFQPIQHGVCHLISRMIIRNFFLDLSDDEFYDDCYIERHGFYNVFHLIETMHSVWSKLGHRGPRAMELHARVAELLARSDDCQDADQWSNLATRDGFMLLQSLAISCKMSKRFGDIERSYSDALSDRLLHDRQVCAYIACHLLQAAPSDKKGGRLQFATRTRWPERVKRIIISRDRGKCAKCGIDISMELLARPHIDHIIPLSVGGCNDLVNLQLYCAQCNLKKNKYFDDVESSIPLYSEGRYLVLVD